MKTPILIFCALPGKAGKAKDCGIGAFTGHHGQERI
jgi:hypothetical protein